MRTKRKGPSVPKRDTTAPGPRTDEAVYADMERELERLNQEMKRLEDLHLRSPSRQTRKALLEMEEAVVELDERIISFLKERPDLAAKVKRPDPMSVKDHLTEEDWRDRLRQQQEDLENSLLEKLRKEQERRQQEWYKSERIRLDEQERKLLNAIADRQAKLEDEWQMRRKHETEAQALAWLRRQQKEIARQLQDGMVRIRQDMESREAQWQQQTKRELAELEREWRTQRNADLQYLEAAWREQEVMHRERAYLRQMEADWRVTQKAMLEEMALKWKEEFQAANNHTIAAHLEAQQRQWLDMQHSWLASLEESNQSWQQQTIEYIEQAISAAVGRIGQQWVAEQRETQRVLLDESRQRAEMERESRDKEWEILRKQVNDWIEQTSLNQDQRQQAWFAEQTEAVNCLIGNWSAQLNELSGTLRHKLETEQKEALRSIAEAFDAEMNKQHVRLEESLGQTRHQYESTLAMWLATGSDNMHKFIADRDTAFKEFLAAKQLELEETMPCFIAEQQTSVQRAVQDTIDRRLELELSKWRGQFDEALVADLEQWRLGAHQKQAELTTAWLTEQAAVYQRKVQEWADSWSQQIRQELDAEVNRQRDEFVDRLDRASHEHERRVTQWIDSGSEQLNRFLADAVALLHETLMNRSTELETELGERLSSLLYERMESELSTWRNKFRALYHADMQEWRQQATLNQQQQTSAWLAEVLNENSQKFADWQAEKLRDLQGAFQTWLDSEHTRHAQRMAEVLASLRQEVIDTVHVTSSCHLSEWQSKFQKAIDSSMEMQVQVQQQLENELRSSVKQQLRDSLSGLEDQLRSYIDDLMENAMVTTSSSVAQRLNEWQEKSLATLGTWVDQKARDVSEEYVRQHQQEIELLGQEIRLDLKRILEETAGKVQAQHESRLAKLGNEYKMAYSEDLKRIEAQMIDSYAQSLNDSRVAWLEESATELKRLAADLLSQEQLVRKDMQVQMVAEYRAALVKAADADAIKRQEQDKRILAELSSRFEQIVAEWSAQVSSAITRWQGAWEKSKQAIAEHFEALRQCMEAEYRDELAAHGAEVFKVHAEGLQRENEKWMQLCNSHMGEVRDTLLAGFESRLLDLQSRLTHEYLEKLESLRSQMHLDYRARLGKLVEELTAKHERQLATLLNGRDEALRKELKDQLLSSVTTAAPTPASKPTSQPPRTRR